MTKVVLFYASWSKESIAAKELLEGINANFSVVDIEVEIGKIKAKQYSVSRIPAILFLNYQSGEERPRLIGYNPQEISNAFSSGSFEKVSNLEDRLKSLVNSAKLMIFIKGTPTVPKCGFTVQLISLFGQNNILDYGYFDVFSDDQIRQGLKEFSQWPTYPQVYLNGELIGGLDIVKEMILDGSFSRLLKE